MTLETHIYHFFKNAQPAFRKVLLGLSGGPDSMALLYLLRDVRERLDLDIAVAHVDHRWRKESAEEAALLKTCAEKLQLPFYLHVLDPAGLKGNLEEACREEGRCLRAQPAQPVLLRLRKITLNKRSK